MNKPQLIEVKLAYVYTTQAEDQTDAVIVSRQIIRDTRYRLVDSFQAEVYLHAGKRPYWEVRRKNRRGFPSHFVTPSWGDCYAADTLTMVKSA